MPYLPRSERCDGYVACEDGSDEANCFACPGTEVVVTPEQRCDGVDDCPGAPGSVFGLGADEYFCDPRALPTWTTCRHPDDPGCAPLLCSDGSPYAAAWRCDGVTDCADGGDEAACP